MEWMDIISTLGFPIACVIALAWFVYKFYNDSTSQYKENIEAIQQASKEREDKLYDEIKLNREVNAKAIETISLYAVSLGVIQKDISDIKEDIEYIKGK